MILRNVVAISVTGVGERGGGQQKGRTGKGFHPEGSTVSDSAAT